MPGTWERRGTVTVTQGSNIVTGVGTHWTDAKNGPQVGNAFYGPDGQAHEVAVIRSATELWLADNYTGVTAANVSYQIDTTRVDTVPGLASRVAAVLGFAQGQYDNLDKWTQGGVDEDVTLTSPNGESVTVPSLPKMGKDYTAIGSALPAAERAETAAERAGSAAVATAEDRADVTINAEQVAASAEATLGYKNTASAAADTATQKAASAATHDASAQDAAARAENAASAVVGAVLDGGECDLSTGVYPQPITVAGKKYSTIWYVAVAGSVSGVAFDVGDLLRYTTAKTGYYFKVDAKDDVYSVNGEKGAVTVSPEKIGAEKTGVAQLLVDQHASKMAAHPISGVSGLQVALDAKPSRNILLNGEVTRINQRGFNGNWTALAVGAYGYDRWKKMDATSMAQVVEAGNFVPGAKYRLSGTGVTASTLTAPASGDWTISVPQAARNVQLELGEVSTPFEIRNIQIELAMCQRYFQSGEGWFQGYGASGSTVQTFCSFKVTMRSAPRCAVTYAPGGYGNVSGATGVVNQPVPSGVHVGDTLVALGNGFAKFLYTADSEL